MKVEFIPNESIEQAADELLADYGARFTQVTEPPVPVEEILECHLDLSLGFDDLQQRLGTPDVLGATWIDEMEVLVDASLDPTIYPKREGRYRFTVAHEVGHWILHRHALKESKQTPLFEGRPEPSIVCRKATRKPRIEIQADRFASYLLMPRELVLRHWESRFGSLQPQVVEDEINQLGGIQDAGVPTVAISKAVAQAFKVSGQAMQIRLLDLNLVLTKQPPKGLFD